MMPQGDSQFIPDADLMAGLQSSDLQASAPVHPEGVVEIPDSDDEPCPDPAVHQPFEGVCHDNLDTMPMAHDNLQDLWGRLAVCVSICLFL